MKLFYKIIYFTIKIKTCQPLTIISKETCLCKDSVALHPESKQLHFLKINVTEYLQGHFTQISVGGGKCRSYHLHD